MGVWFGANPDVERTSDYLGSFGFYAQLQHTCSLGNEGEVVGTIAIVLTVNRRVINVSEGRSAGGFEVGCQQTSLDEFRSSCKHGQFCSSVSDGSFQPGTTDSYLARIDRFYNFKFRRTPCNPCSTYRHIQRMIPFLER